jgi:hypothetical protein
VNYNFLSSNILILSISLIRVTFSNFSMSFAFALVFQFSFHLAFLLNLYFLTLPLHIIKCGGGIILWRKVRLLLIVTVLISALLLLLIYPYKKNIDLINKSTQVIEKLDYCIYIEIDDKTLYLLEEGKCIKKYAISSGTPNTPSPLGYWKIIEKGDWGEGFGGRWLGLNVPWGTYGIHGTIFSHTIGSSASHGCIRMYNLDVQELYRIVPIGTPVVIVNGSFGPFGTGFKDIDSGDRGADVMAIQQRLKELGYYKGLPSGIYEDDLKLALHRFQKEKGLEMKNLITKQDWLKMGFREFE